MASFTRESARFQVKRVCLLQAMAVLALVLSGCAPVQEDFGIELAVVSVTGTQVGIKVRARQDVRLSDEARSALLNGVPLHIRVDMMLHKPGQWTASENKSIYYEIRYLPLSDRYQLSGPLPGEAPVTFPRLRHVIAELSDIDWQFETMAGEPGQYSLEMRSQLDRTSMPGPMQLPMLFSANWAHDSGWIIRDFEVEG